MKTGKLIGQLDSIQNLQVTVNAAVNKLDIFAKSTGAVPTSADPIWVKIPDGTGAVYRKRNATYLSGDSQFTMADAANYWSKGSLDAEIKTAWVYAIWDGTGIVWALAGYSGFTMVPTTTTVTDDDYFLLESSSTYTRSNDHYCVAVCKIRYQYDTADTPDHTIQATVTDAPVILWNPKSDYGKMSTLATTNTSGSNIALYSAVSAVVKQSGYYYIVAQLSANATGTAGAVDLQIKTGSATYANATLRSLKYQNNLAAGAFYIDLTCACSCYLNAGDTIHLGASCAGTSGNRVIYGDSNSYGYTLLAFNKVD